MHLRVGEMSRKKPLQFFLYNSIFWGNPGEIMVHMYHGMCMTVLPFLSPTPIPSNHM